MSGPAYAHVEHVAYGFAGLLDEILGFIVDVGNHYHVRLKPFEFSDGSPPNLTLIANRVSESFPKPALVS